MYIFLFVPFFVGMIKMEGLEYFLGFPFDSFFFDFSRHKGIFLAYPSLFFSDGLGILFGLVFLFLGWKYQKFARYITGHIVGLPVKACISFNYATQRKQNEKRYAKTIEENHKTTVRRTREMEEAKATGQAEAMLKMYKGQLSLLQDHKKRGLDIEQETFELRKKLLQLESEENEKMINDMIKTLDRL
jgi:hypothetical protein